MHKPALPFALFFAPEAYSMAGKIMGRQSAGHSFLKAVSKRAGQSTVHVAGPLETGAESLRGVLADWGNQSPVHWHALHKPETLKSIGALYYPAPPSSAIASLRNGIGPSAFSCFGVTHTLASDSAMAQMAALTLPPFKSWDALICTSRAARAVFGSMRDSMRETLARETGATRFPDVQAPIIPLGVDVDAFRSRAPLRAATRQRFAISERDVVLLSAGRLAFHAKFNPAPLYRALAALPAKLRARTVLVEAGIYPNQGIEHAFCEAHAVLAQGVRILTVDGREMDVFAGLWQAADLFVSLSDNVQETFGLTPVEAMAAGLPVIATDWDGYRDTVRHGQDGFLIPTIQPAPGLGTDLARRYAAGLDTYDMYIGRLSLTAAVDHDALGQALATLIADPALRARMGAAGRAHARARFDWSHILDQYASLCGALGEIRQKVVRDTPEIAPDRPDPFSLFASYPTRHLGGADRISARVGAQADGMRIFKLKMTNFGFNEETLPLGLVHLVLKSVAAQERTLAELIADAGKDRVLVERAVLWLAKFGLVDVSRGLPRSESASCTVLEESGTISR